MSKYRHAKKPGLGKIITISLISLLSIALIVGGVFAATTLFSSDDKTEETFATKAPTKPVETQVPTEPHTEDPQQKYTNLAQEYTKTMTDDEKIYQLLMVTPEALTGVDVATQAGDTTKQVLTEKNVGGIYYNAQNFEDPTQTLDLISKTKSFAKHPLFIAVTESGGDNSPINSKLETTNSNTTAKDDSAISSYLAKYGFNLNFAPNVNIDENNENTKTAELAKAYVSEAAKIYQDKAIIPAINFFPVSADSTNTYDQMKTSEFVPFVSAIENGADAITISAAKVSAIDADFPAFMSNRIVTEILRQEFNFNGVVLTPILSDDNTGSYSVDDIVTKSINAGVNMFVCPSDVDTYVTAIKNALDKGLIKQSQIDESVTKILTLKFKYGIIKEAQTPDATQNATESTQASTTASTQPATDPTQIQ